MKRFLYIIPALLVAFASSCVEDEGNYDYKVINEVSIEDDDDVITVLSHVDHVKITPTITGSLFDDDLSNYEFKYTLCHNNHTHTVIGTEKDLDWPANVNPGSYSIYLSVKDKTTGIEKITQSPRRIMVKSPFSTGFLVLGENLEEGRSQVDMIAILADVDTVMAYDVFDRSEMELHNASRIIFTGEVPEYLGLEAKYAQNLWVCSPEGDFQFTNAESFEYLNSFDNAGIIEPAVGVKRPMKLVELFPAQGRFGIHKSRSSRGYLTEDMLYFAAVNRNDYHTQPLNRYDINSQNYFKPAPYMFYNAYSNVIDYIMGYDLSNDMFYKLPSKNSAYLNLYVSQAPDYGGEAWKTAPCLEAIPRTLVYGENTYLDNNGTSFAVMKDKQGPGYYIYKMIIPYSNTGSVDKDLFYVDPEIAPLIAQASHLAFSSFRSALFFSIGKRLYQYDFSYNKYIYLDFDDEITYLHTDGVSDGEKDEFFVATYGDVNKGTIYKYTHTDNPNTLDFRLMNGEVWHTDTRVVDIEWKDAK